MSYRFHGSRRFIALAAALFLVALMLSVGEEGTLQARQASAAGAPSQTYQDVYNGWKWWHVYCFRCHGTDAVGTTMAPNLTDPNEKQSAAEFLKVVKNGVPDKGMQAWNKMLDDKQIGQIHLYVRARTDKVLPPGRPDEVGPNGGPWVPPARWPAK